MRFVMAIATAVLAITSAPAQAAPTFFERYLAKGKCYSKLYDVRHLRKNPQQTLSKFHIYLDDKDPINAQRPRAYAVHFGFWVKNGGYYDGVAKCRTTSAGEACSAEADGGQFALTGAGRQIKVTLSDRLTVEGAKGFSPNVATAANRTLLLPVAPGAYCNRR